MGATTIDLTFFLSRCEREFTPTEIVLTATDNFHAEGLRRCCVELAKWALSKGRDSVVVQWAGDKGNPYRIPSWYASLENSTPNVNESGATPMDRKPISEMGAECGFKNKKSSAGRLDFKGFNKILKFSSYQRQDIPSSTKYRKSRKPRRVSFWIDLIL